MSAIRTRQEARERITKYFFDELDRVIPADESVPLKGQTFRDFELQARQIKESVIPTMLEERAALSESALQQQAGLCPHCGSDRTYLGSRVRKRELRSPDGAVTGPPTTRIPTICTWQVLKFHQPPSVVCN